MPIWRAARCHRVAVRKTALKRSTTRPRTRDRRTRPQPKLATRALSHRSYWRTKENPDPNGETLDLIVGKLKKMWSEFEKAKVTDVGVIIDWCALFQAPRTPEQDKAFGLDLKGINLWCVARHARHIRRHSRHHSLAAAAAVTSPPPSPPPPSAPPAGTPTGAHSCS